MSTNATKWAWDLRDVPFNEKIVLLCIADHADKFGRNAFPGLPLIAAECGMSRRAVIDNIARLEERGAIIKTKRKGGETGGSTSNLYTLPITGGAASALSVDSDVEVDSEGAAEPAFARGADAALSSEGADAAPPPDSAAAASDSAANARDSAVAAPEPSVEPSIEPPERETRARERIFGFDNFVAAFPHGKRKGLDTAADLWVREGMASRAEFFIADVADRAERDRQWRDGFGPYPTSYIRGKRWKDEVELPREPNAKRIPDDDATLLAMAKEAGIDTYGKSRWDLQQALRAQQH